MLRGVGLATMDGENRFGNVLRLPLGKRASPAKHYVGFTSDLKARLVRRNAGQNPSTAADRPWAIAGYVAFRLEAKAVTFEKYLKSGSGRTFAKRHLF
jgi:predicted GIY-YIG superfamily endonuclease